MKRIAFILAVMACFSFAGVQVLLATDGAAIYKKGCAGCHGQNAERSAGGTKALKTNSSADLYRMMMGYKDGSYGGKQKVTMQNVVKKFSDEDLKAVSDYIDSLE